MKLGDISKLIGAKWKECADKSPYEASAAKDKARYDEEMKSYTPPAGFGPAAGAKSPKRKVVKDPNAPKRVCVYSR
jgi:hypothetical protein